MRFLAIHKETFAFGSITVSMATTVDVRRLKQATETFVRNLEKAMYAKIKINVLGVG